MVRPVVGLRALSSRRGGAADREATHAAPASATADHEADGWRATPEPSPDHVPAATTWLPERSRASYETGPVGGSTPAHAAPPDATRPGIAPDGLLRVADALVETRLVGDPCVLRVVGL